MRSRTIFLSISRQLRASLFSEYLSESNNLRVTQRVGQCPPSSKAHSIASLSSHQFVFFIAHRLRLFTSFTSCGEKGYFGMTTCLKEIWAKLVQLIAGPWGVSMNADLTFHRSGTGPAVRRADRVPSLPMPAIHLPRQPAIPDEGRRQKYVALRFRFEVTV